MSEHLRAPALLINGLLTLGECLRVTFRLTAMRNATRHEMNHRVGSHGVIDAMYAKCLCDKIFGENATLQMQLIPQ